MPYEDYQTNDFVTDPFFRKWVLAPDEETQTFWSQWLQQHSAKSLTIQHARLLVRATNLPPVTYSDEDYQETWEKIRAGMVSPETETFFSHSNTKPQVKSRSWLRVAAVVAALALLGAYLISQLIPSPQHYSTGYGEILDVTLPMDQPQY